MRILPNFDEVRAMIGFSPGVPENTDETWQSDIGGQTFTFRKTFAKHGFIYECRCGSGNNISWKSVYLRRNIRSAKVEQLKQFAQFIKACWS